MLAAFLIVAAGLHLGRPVLAPVLLAGFVAAVTAPLVLWLRARRVPTALAVAAGLLVDALIIGAMTVVVGMAVAELAGRQAFYEQRFGELLEQTRAWLLARGVELSADSLRTVLDPNTLLDFLGQGLQRVAALLSQFVLVLFIVAFMLFEATTLRSKIEVVIRDGDEMLALRETAGELRGFLVVKFATSATTAVLAGLLCWGLKVDLPLLWALLAFLLNFIPTVGSIIAAIPPTLLALVLYGPGTALAVAGGYSIFNLVIGSFIEPRLMGRTLGLSPLVVFLSMLLWGYLLGVVGALLSPTLTMFVKAWMERTEDMRWAAVLMGPAPTDIPKDAEDTEDTADQPAARSAD